MLLIKTFVGEDTGSASRAASINREYFILHMAMEQHGEQIKLDMLMLENQLLFAVVKLLVSTCGWHFVEQVVVDCFDNAGTRRPGYGTPRRQVLN
jgi:hypothetical protein